MYIQEYIRRGYGARDVLPYVQSRSTEVGFIVIAIVDSSIGILAECNNWAYLARG